MKKLTTLLMLLGISLFFATDSYAPPPTFPPLQVTEVDGSPSGVVTKIQFSNGSVSDISGGVATVTTGSAAGQPITLDLADDGSNESSDLGEIATYSTSCGSIFSESSADKLLIDCRENWPTSDEADTLSTALTHELGGLETDVSSYAGLVAIDSGATAQVDELSELNALITDATLLDDGAIADSTAIGLDAGDTYTNFGGADDDTLNELFAAVDSAIVSGDAFTVKVDSDATADYIGNAYDDGVIQTDGTIVTKTDGGDYVTIGVHAYLADIAGITAAQGDVIYFDGTNWVNLGPGIDGQYLMTQGAAANPTWSSLGVPGDVEAVGDCPSGGCFTADGAGNALYFEGATPNNNEVMLTAADPGADITITIPISGGSSDILLGPTGGMTGDNRLVRTDGTPTSKLQNSGISLDDSDNINNVATIGVTGTYIALGSNPADAGNGIRITNAYSLLFEDTEGTAEVNALSVNSSEYVLIGSSGADGVTITPATTITGAATFTGGIASIGAASNLSGGTVTLGTVAGTITDGTASWNATTHNLAGFVDFTITGDGIIGDDFSLKSDSAVLNFGADSDVTLTHVADTGLNMNQSLAVADDKLITFGGNLAGYDWKVSYDEASSDALEFTHTAGAGADVTFDLNDNAADSTFAIGNSDATYATNVTIDGDLTLGGVLTVNSSGDSYIQLTNNASGLAPANNRIYFETDATFGDVLSYSIGSTEKRFANLGDAQEFTALKTFGAGLSVNNGATSSGFVRLYEDSDNGTNYQAIAAPAAVTSNFTFTLPDGGSVNKYLKDSDGSGTLVWDTPSASAATDGGTAGVVQFNTGGALDADASFLYTEATYTLLIGESNGSSLDGKLTLFNEGGTDYTVTIQPGTQGGDATITLPTATSTLATLGIAETFTAAKTLTAAAANSTVSSTTFSGAPAMNGSDVHRDIFLDHALGTITGTTNTIAMIDVDALTGDAETNLYAFRIGNLTGTTGSDGEVEYGINIGTGWDMGIYSSSAIQSTVSVITPLLDAAGAEDMDYGSADVTDHTFTTNDCTVVIDGGVTVSTGDHIVVGTTQWDNGSDAIDGEQIAADTIDDDSIDFSDVTCADITTSDCGAITSTGVTVTTGNHITVGTTQWDDGSDAIDGEKIAADTIDDDSIDFSDVTCADITMSDCGTITSATIVTDLIDTTGATDIDIGSGDVTDVTLVTDGGADSLTIGDGTAGYDYGLTIDGEDSNVIFLWDEDGSVLNIDTDDTTNEEGLAIDFDTATNNEVSINTHSSTGTTQINFNALNVVTTGTIAGGISSTTDADGMSQGEMTAAGMYGEMYFATGAGTWNLPAIATGMNFCIYSTTAAAVVLNPDDADRIILNGSAQADGATITSASAAGDFICLMVDSAAGWVTLGRSGTWTSP